MRYALSIMYHRLGDYGRYSVNRSSLDWQIESLKRRGFRFVFAEELAHWSPCDGKVCALTFDDGTIDNLSLSDLDVPITIFVCTDPDPKEIGCDASDLDPQKLVAGLRQYDHIRFGSHGITHRRWTRISSEELDHELRSSKAMLEDWTGQSVCCCAYPKGSVNPAVRTAVSQVYDCAFLADGGAMKSYASDPFQIPRIGIFHETRVWGFRMRTHPYFNILITLRNQWKKFRQQ